MKKEFVPYDESSILKKIGFDEVCFAIYEDEEFVPLEAVDVFGLNRNSVFLEDIIAAPLYQQAIDWLRKEHNLFYMDDIGSHEFSYRIYDTKKEKTLKKNILHPFGFDFNGTPEEAKLEGLRVIIKKVSDELRSKTIDKILDNE